jgi:hypothetical protein
MYALGRIGKVIVFSARRGPIYAQLLTGIIRQTALPPAPAGGLFFGRRCSMFWVRVFALLAGWMVLPPLAWALAHEVLRSIRSLHVSDLLVLIRSRIRF